MAISGISSALSAVQRQTLAVDTAAAKVARAGLAESAAVASGGGEAAVESTDGLSQGMVELVVATRMLSAAFKLAQVTNENMLAVIQSSGYLSDAA